jgi:acyl dehydratase
MTTEVEDRGALPVYRVRAHNTAIDSENKIHDDAVAAQFGFRGGLVPGVTVFGYMSVPLVERFSLTWLEQGSMKVRFLRPFYEGDDVVVCAAIKPESGPVRLDVTAAREGGPVCATATAILFQKGCATDDADLLGGYPEQPLPDAGARLPAESSCLRPGTILGSLNVKMDLGGYQAELLDRIGERLPVYLGRDGVAHPMILLGLANRILVENVKLGPWIHAESLMVNRSLVRDGDEISVRGRIADCFERKGNEFVSLDVITASRDRLVNRIRHTAIYRIRRG